MPYRVEVIADETGEWVGNQLKFATREEAEQYAKDLFSRWTAVREWRVVEEPGRKGWDPRGGPSTLGASDISDETATLVRSHWNFPGLIEDLGAQEWSETEPGRVDRMAWIGSYQTIERLARETVTDEEWHDAEQGGFEHEIVDEYLEALGSILSETMGEHVYTATDNGEVYIGQYDHPERPGSAGRKDWDPRAELGAVELIELGQPHVRTSRYGPLTAQVFRYRRGKYAVYDVTLWDDFGNRFHIDNIEALNHREAARQVIDVLSDALDRPEDKWHQSALQFGGALDEAMEFVEDVRGAEEGAFMGAARKKKRIPYREAMEIARQIEQEIHDNCDPAELILVGSLRRKRAEIADVEFVLLPMGAVETEEGPERQEGIERCAECLRGLGYAIGGKLRKATKTVEGVKIEIYLAHDRVELGGLVFMYTGDFQFNIAMRRKAKLQGLKLNQYGIWDEEGNPVLQSPDERDFFRFLEVEYHTPEERSVATRTPEEKRRRAEKKRKKRKRRRAPTKRRPKKKGKRKRKGKKKGKRKKRKTVMKGPDSEIYERMEQVWEDDPEDDPEDEDDDDFEEGEEE